jgi:hypothetical protein
MEEPEDSSNRVELLAVGSKRIVALAARNGSVRFRKRYPSPPPPPPPLPVGVCVRLPGAREKQRAEATTAKFGLGAWEREERRGGKGERTGGERDEADAGFPRLTECTDRIQICSHV